MQYTIRKIPKWLDAALRRRAREQNKSLNEVVIETLARGIEFTLTQAPKRDLSHIAATWRRDRAFDQALAAQDSIDREMWR